MMKYESEILYDLMKRDGLLNPSQDNLPYESELKEKYVNEVEGAYPKLQDYRAEWLNYNKCEYIPADFPTESQVNQTSGTFQNVIPFAYDVATLKGQTLVNLLNFDNKVTNNIQNVNKEINKISWTTREYYSKLGFKINVNPNTSYCIYYSSKTEFNICYRNADSIDTEAKQPQILNDNFIKITSESNSIITITFEYKSEVATHEVYDLMVFEYQEGMENWDISYFEGMQSVQMPVLTTAGKNLWDNKVIKNCPIATINSDGSVTLNGTLSHHWMFDYTIDKGTYVSSAIGNDNGYIHLFWDGGDDFFQKQIPFTISEKVTRQGYITSGIYENINVKLQLEEGTQSTPYEPYKSNILTVNEDVTLRSNGGVYDELNLLTGRLTQRIDENNEVLAQEVVKTVDLSCINECNAECDFIPLMGTMRYQTSSDIIPPLVDLTVCVEATTQNLASFVHLEGVEHNE